MVEKKQRVNQRNKEYNISFEGVYLWDTVEENKIFVPSALCMWCNWLLQT